MARFDMGNMEFAGVGVGNNADAMFELGLVYATGKDGDVDIVSAHKWFNLAAFGGNEIAKIRREELAAEMSKEQIATAQRAAREWVTSH